MLADFYIPILSNYVKIAGVKFCKKIQKTASKAQKITKSLYRIDFLPQNHVNL